MGGSTAFEKCATQVVESGMRIPMEAIKNTLEATENSLKASNLKLAVCVAAESSLKEMQLFHPA